MNRTLTRVSIVGAVILSGLLAGMAVDRWAVQLPGWRQLGPIPWARFARVADLRAGLAYYPALGLGALLCSVVAAVSLGFDRRDRREAAVPVYGAAILAVAALLVTRYRIAPAMLGLAGLDDRGVGALSNSFAMVQSWWTLKAMLHALTFVASVWALISLAPRDRTDR
jgi:hypothetical protein